MSRCFQAHFLYAHTVTGAGRLAQVSGVGARGSRGRPNVPAPLRDRNRVVDRVEAGFLGLEHLPVVHVVEKPEREEHLQVLLFGVDVVVGGHEVGASYRAV